MSVSPWLLLVTFDSGMTTTPVSKSGQTERELWERTKRSDDQPKKLPPTIGSDQTSACQFTNTSGCTQKISYKPDCR